MRSYGASLTPRKSLPERTRFFFQAVDCIRSRTVTGVQTCALPISVATLVEQLRAVDPAGGAQPQPRELGGGADLGASAPRAGRPAMRACLAHQRVLEPFGARDRSEERRVGKEFRGR